MSRPARPSFPPPGSAEHEVLTRIARAEAEEILPLLHEDGAETVEDVTAHVLSLLKAGHLRVCTAGDDVWLEPVPIKQGDA